MSGPSSLPGEAVFSPPPAPAVPFAAGREAGEGGPGGVFSGAGAFGNVTRRPARVAVVVSVPEPEASGRLSGGTGPRTVCGARAAVRRGVPTPSGRSDRRAGCPSGAETANGRSVGASGARAGVATRCAGMVRLKASSVRGAGGGVSCSAGVNVSAFAAGDMRRGSGRLTEAAAVGGVASACGAGGTVARWRAVAARDQSGRIARRREGGVASAAEAPVPTGGGSSLDRGCTVSATPLGRRTGWGSVPATAGSARPISGPAEPRGADRGGSVSGDPRRSFRGRAGPAAAAASVSARMSRFVAVCRDRGTVLLLSPEDAAAGSASGRGTKDGSDIGIGVAAVRGGVSGVVSPRPSR